MENISGSELAQMFKAASFAADKHRSQRRKDSAASPYINHPLALAHILCSEGKITDPEVLISALLHDTLEDTETSYDEIEREFGAAVASVVAEVTDDKSLPKAERKRLQVSKAASKSRAAKLVKLADKISNLRDIAVSPPLDWPLERREAYFHWAKDVVEGLRGENSALEAAFDEAYEVGLRTVRAAA
jgi:GTP diphosphokinase / guanosine-3',5'-bis(diphosphate) 3'-diphosphatase